MVNPGVRAHPSDQGAQPVAAQPAAQGLEQGAGDSAQGFAEQLQRAAAPVQDVAALPVDLLPVELPPVELAEFPALAEPADPTQAALPQGAGEAELAQAEALLVRLLAQQQQQVQAQPAGESGDAARRAAEALASLPAARLTNAQTGEAKAAPSAAELPRGTFPSLPVGGVVAAPSTVARTDAPAPVTGDSAAALESLLAGTKSGGETPSAGVAGSTTTPAHALAERTLKLEGSQAQRGEQMLHALRDSVELQVQQKVQSATIRLDPPELGKLEILVSQESGRINIQINASQADTLRLLQQTSDRLRHELLTQHFVQVNVQVGADGQGQRSRQEQAFHAQRQIRENALEAGGREARHRDAADVLVTV